jgi:hypothetical protein
MPAAAGGKDAEMAEDNAQQNDGSPPADGDGGAADNTSAQLESLQKQVQDLLKNQQVLSDTIAADKPGVTAEQVAELVTTTVSQILTQREEQAQQQQAQQQQAAEAQAQRDALVDKLVTEKLGGDRELAGFLTGETEEQLAASAETLAAKLRAIKPDFGGASKAGGEIPAGTGNERSFKSLLR